MVPWWTCLRCAAKFIDWWPASSCQLLATTWMCSPLGLWDLVLVQGTTKVNPSEARKSFTQHRQVKEATPLLEWCFGSHPFLPSLPISCFLYLWPVWQFIFSLFIVQLSEFLTHLGRNRNSIFCCIWSKAFHHWLLVILGLKISYLAHYQASIQCWHVSVPKLSSILLPCCNLMYMFISYILFFL